jgi:hypothetical protein
MPPRFIAQTLRAPLLDEGGTNIAVLDVSAALARTKARLGGKGTSVRFIVADVTAWEPDFPADLWHDRVVLHFLTDPQDRAAYADALRRAVRPGSGCRTFGPATRPGRSPSPSCTKGARKALERMLPGRQRKKRPKTRLVGGEAVPPMRSVERLKTRRSPRC